MKVLNPSLKIASWNINSVRLRLDLLKNILQKYQFDVICLQEIKTQNIFFPKEELVKSGYPYISFRGEKSYNGVAIISKIPFQKDFFYDFCQKGDKRHLAVQLENGITIHNFYIPAGGDEPDREKNPKFAHKLDFIDEMTQKFANDSVAKTVILGDFNVAPLENDVWSHKQLLNVVSHTPIEVNKLNLLQKSANFVDSHREFVQNSKKLYSWWSYRARDWQKSNRGRRLDHIWLSEDLKKNLLSANIYSETRGRKKPSDHSVIDISISL